MEQLTLFETVSPDPATRYVYAGVRNGQIKIGISSNPARRAKQLGLTLLRVMPGDETTERELHRRFRAARIDREWFMPTAEVLSWLSPLDDVPDEPAA
jgi:hypothetical protein